MAQTNAQKQKAYRVRQTIRGKVLKQIWVTAAQSRAIDKLLSREYRKSAERVTREGK